MTADLQPVQNDPASLLRLAIEKGMDPEQLGKLLDLQREWSRDRAAEGFATALTAFQRECPQIDKWKAGNKAKYAPYETVMAVAGPIMVKYGIVASFTTEDKGADAGLWITCRVRVGTHAEDTNLPIPSAETAGVVNKAINDAQAMGVRVSYGKRYALCAALNIVTRDEDEDGMAAGLKLNRDQVGILNDLIARCQQAGQFKSLSSFCNWLVEGAADLSQIPQTKFGQAKYELERRLKEAKK